MKGNKFTPKTNLDEFLTNNFNIKYYQYLLNDGVGIFEPLEFFNLFYKTLEYCKLNKNKPERVIKHINNIELTYFQRHILLDSLIEYFFPFIIHKEIRILREYLGNAIAKIDLEHESHIERIIRKIEDFFQKPISMSKDKSYWTNLNKIIEKIPNPTQRIEFLIRIKAKYQEDKSKFPKDLKITLAEQCDIEIKKIRDIQALHSEPTKKTSNKKKVKKEIPKDLQLKDVLKND